MLNRIKLHLEASKPVRTFEFQDDEKDLLKDIFLLTIKPIIYVANVSEEQLSNIENDENVNLVKEYAKNEGAQVVTLCAKLEEDLSELDDEDRLSLMKDFGMNLVLIN